MPGVKTKALIRMHWMSPFRRDLAACVVYAFCAAPPLAHCTQDPSPPLDLSELDLEGLGNLQVTLASRKSQRFKDTAAAVFVITNEDIRRSGATNIPDVLRMVPGVQVAYISNDRWAVSIRGFNGRYASKLLVQIDGRSIYSPLFSGVFWEAQDMVLEDIERIEVLRGPGAAMWGANAVNGIINIITKKAADTLGSLVQVGVGTQEKGSATLRYGGQIDEDTHYRIYGKGYVRAESVNLNGTGAGDNSKSQHTGFRLDRRVDGDRQITVSGDIYEANSRESFKSPSLSQPYYTVALTPGINRGAHVLARHEQTLEDGSVATLQTYADFTENIIGSLVTERRATYDLDFQRRMLLDSRHELIWGVNYRLSQDAIQTLTPSLQISPEQETYQVIGSFVHYESALVPDRLKLITGIKIEHDSYTGTQPQPNLRMVWTPDASHTFWAAWSRAVRTPARAGRGTDLDVQVLPPNSVGNSTAFPVLLRLRSPGTLNTAEKLTALEAGYRAQLAPGLSMDLTAFVNQYAELFIGAQESTQFRATPIPHLLMLSTLGNSLSGYNQGLEAAFDWRPHRKWHLQTSYTLLRMGFPTTSGDALRDAAAQNLMDQTPANQLSLRSIHDLAPGHQLDLWLRYVSRVAFGDIPAYTTLDVRYGWRPKKHLDISFIGQNLLTSRHTEFVQDVTSVQTLQMQRGVYLRVTWNY